MVFCECNRTMKMTGWFIGTQKHTNDLRKAIEGPIVYGIHRLGGEENDRIEFIHSSNLQ